MTVAAAPISHAGSRTGRDLAKLSLGALGVVYGDIGTSPLYAVKECFTRPFGVDPTPENVMGVLSLIVWSLTFVIVVKYMTFIMRADNHGEGGILALLALLRPANGAKSKGGIVLVMLGLFGAALLYGDGMITPAISVLSAIEGLGVATSAFERAVIPLTVAILIGLFMMQKRGTAGIGLVFGPTMLIWFACIAALGVPWILREPSVLKSINPLYAVNFFLHHKLHGFLVLGAVVLCITGGEALYADMGHFGPRPIRIAWYAVVFPSLLLNYFGQGALLIHHGEAAADNPFYGMISGWMLYPLVGVATMATVVASQALISGAFSLTQQAVQLGYWPRVTIVHTSGDAEGQIFVPEVNRLLMIACVALVLAFRKSSNLAAAYGIAVTGTMTITSLLFYAVARARWKWSLWKAGSVTVLFLTFDLAFFFSNMTKVLEGGWVPLTIAAGIFTIMTTWKRGRESLGAFLRTITLPISIFMEDMGQTMPYRVKGTAVFMTSSPDGVPPVLLHHFKHNKVLHEKVVLLSITTSHTPEVPAEGRIQEIRDLGHGMHQVTAAYGFMQMPNVLEVLRGCAEAGLKTNHDDTSFFLGRETLLITDRPGMARWRKELFAYLSRNARPATAFFRIPPNRVVELGTQIEL